MNIQYHYLLLTPSMIKQIFDLYNKTYFEYTYVSCKTTEFCALHAHYKETIFGK